MRFQYFSIEFLKSAKIKGAQHLLNLFPFGANKTCARDASRMCHSWLEPRGLSSFFWWRKDRKPVYQIVEKKELRK